MKKQILISILILSLIQNCQNSYQPLDNQSATTHFYNNVKQVAEDQLGYQIRQDTKVSQDSFTLILYNKQTYAATVSLKFERCYNTYANYKAIFSIKGVHSQDVTKYVYNYYDKEMDMQFQVIPQLILRQGELELDSNNNQVKKPFFLHLIQDVRMNIIENNKQHKIDFDISFEEKDFNQIWQDFQGQGMVETMVLKSRETIIAIIEIFITEKFNIGQDTFDKKNYLMNVCIRKTNDHSQIPQIIQIPMISRNVDEFKAYMRHLNIFLDLDSYSNNNKEHYLNIIKFLQDYFPKKKFDVKTLTDIEKQWNNIEFNIQQDKKIANFKLIYIPSNKNNQNGYYQLQTTQDSKIKQDFQFERMKNDDFQLLLKKQKIQSLFQPIYDIIMEIFQEKHEEIILEKQPNWKLTEHKVETNMFSQMVSSNEYGYKVNQTLLFLCDTHSNSKFVQLTYKVMNLKGLLFSHKFPVQKFSMQATTNFIDTVLRNHLNFMKEFYKYDIYNYV